MHTQNEVRNICDFLYVHFLSDEVLINQFCTSFIIKLKKNISIFKIYSIIGFKFLLLCICVHLNTNKVHISRSTQRIQIAQNRRFELALAGGKVRKCYLIQDQRNAQSRTFMNRRIVLIRRKHVYIIYYSLTFLQTYILERVIYLLAFICISFVIHSVASST